MKGIDFRGANLTLKGNEDVYDLKARRYIHGRDGVCVETVWEMSDEEFEQVKANRQVKLTTILPGGARFLPCRIEPVQEHTPEALPEEKIDEIDNIIRETVTELTKKMGLGPEIKVSFVGLTPYQDGTCGVHIHFEQFEILPFFQLFMTESFTNPGIVIPNVLGQLLPAYFTQLVNYVKVETGEE